MAKADWTIRRRVVVATLAFCGGEVLYLTVYGRDIELHGTIAASLILLAGSVIGSYVFGATWDDKNEREAERRGWHRRRRDEDSDPTPPEGFAS